MAAPSTATAPLARRGRRLRSVTLVDRRRISTNPFVCCPPQRMSGSPRQWCESLAGFRGKCKQSPPSLPFGDHERPPKLSLRTGHRSSRPVAVRVSARDEQGVKISRLRKLAVIAVVGLVLPLSSEADIGAVQLVNSTELTAAISALRNTGGTIRLRRNHYAGDRVVGPPTLRPGRCTSSASGACSSKACSSRGLSTSRSAGSRSHRSDRTRGCASAAHATSNCVRPSVTTPSQREPGARASRQIEPRRHPAQRVPSLWQPLAALFQLPAAKAWDEAYPHRPQLVPRLPGLRTSFTAASATT